MNVICPCDKRFWFMAAQTVRGNFDRQNSGGIVCNACEARSTRKPRGCHLSIVCKGCADHARGSFCRHPKAHSRQNVEEQQCRTGQPFHKSAILSHTVDEVGSFNLPVVFSSCHPVGKKHQRSNQCYNLQWVQDHGCSSSATDPLGKTSGWESDV